MKKPKTTVEAAAWFEQDAWVVNVFHPADDKHIAFGTCKARQNVAKTALAAAAEALNVGSSQIKLTKVDYIGTHRS